MWFTASLWDAGLQVAKEPHFRCDRTGMHASQVSTDRGCGWEHLYCQVGIGALASSRRLHCHSRQPSLDISYRIFTFFFRFYLDLACQSSSFYFSCIFIPLGPSFLPSFIFSPSFYFILLSITAFIYTKHLKQDFCCENYQIKKFP